MIVYNPRYVFRCLVNCRACLCINSFSDYAILFLFFFSSFFFENIMNSKKNLTLYSICLKKYRVLCFLYILYDRYIYIHHFKTRAVSSRHMRALAATVCGTAPFKCTQHALNQNNGFIDIFHQWCQ